MGKFEKKLTMSSLHFPKTVKKKMREPTGIIVHHSASMWGSACIIDEWHRERGFSLIGYHFVIGNGYPTYEDFLKKRKWDILDGRIECGRPLDRDKHLEKDEIGAHALGINSKTIGVCLINDHGYKLSRNQLFSLDKLCLDLMDAFKSISVHNIQGHYEVDSNKPYCPGIDMDKWREMMNLRYFS